MKGIILAFAIALQGLLIIAQNKGETVATVYRTTIALPENTLPFPFCFRAVRIESIEVVKGKPFRDFQGTEYFNPAESIINQEPNEPVIQVIGALRFYLDSSIWESSITDSSENNFCFPFKLANLNVSDVLNPFYFKKTEVTNREYREFTTWVRDSIARRLLAEMYPEQYYTDTTCKTLDWNAKVVWKGKDGKVNEALRVLYYEESDQLFGLNEQDTHKLIYTYIDNDNRLQNVPIYPDTLVWHKDFPFSNTVMSPYYFNSKSYNDYPITGINFHQAKAFCHWKTRQIQKSISQKEGFTVEVDLPFDYEREYVITQFKQGEGADVSCITNLMAINKQESYPALLDKMLRRNNTVQFAGINNNILFDSDKKHISGLGDNVSEWMNESYANNWYPFIAKRRQLLESINPAILKQDYLKGNSGKDSLYLDNLCVMYNDEIPLMLKVENLFEHYCDVDGRLVRGGNWIFNGNDEEFRSVITPSKTGNSEAMTFVSPSKSSSIIGFRYVIRVRPIKHVF